MIRPESFSKQWPVKSLGSVVEFLDHKRVPITASDRKAGPYPYYGANGQQDSVDGYLFDEPLLLLAEDGGNFSDPSRDIAYIARGKYWVNNHAHVIKPTSVIDLEYLWRVMARYDVTPYIKGATRAKLSKSDASRIPIPLPPLATQKHIARVLEQADQLRKQAQQMERELNQLAQSLFLEMFGDPVANPKGWPMTSLENLLEFMTSGSRGWAEYYDDDGVDDFLRIQNVLKDKLDVTDIQKITAPDTKEAQRTKVQDGDVLLSITADLGRTAVIRNLRRPTYINQHLALLRVDKSKVVPEFLSTYLASPAGEIQFTKKNKGGTKAGLNFDDIRTVDVVIPPVEMQDAYREKKKHIDQKIEQVVKSVSTYETLFSALMQRAFNGELVAPERKAA